MPVLCEGIHILRSKKAVRLVAAGWLGTMFKHRYHGVVKNLEADCFQNETVTEGYLRDHSQDGPFMGTRSKSTGISKYGGYC